MENTLKEILKEQAWNIRHEVMWPDKSFEYIILEDDEDGLHFGLFNKEKLVSVISLFINGEEVQFRKFATLQQEQGKVWQ